MVVNERKWGEEEWEDFGEEVCDVVKDRGKDFDMKKVLREVEEFEGKDFM